MKLIIDISEEDYRECKFRKDLLSLDGEPTDLTFNMRMETTIANGAPLEGEFEKIKDEIQDYSLWSANGNSAENVFLLTRDLSVSIIDKHIAELKGDNNGNG